ncbi:substrate-binding domain-containing protein [Peribacillus simplex]
MKKREYYEKNQKKCLQGKNFIVVFPYKVNEIDFIQGRDYGQALIRTGIGLSVPEDIAIVGFDNLKIASIFNPHITTIDQPKYEIGKKATNLLLTLMKGGTIEKKKFVLEDELIIRESCGSKLEKGLNA